MASEVSICNQALGWLGQSPITSLDDPSTHAQLCKNNYAPLRDTVLESASWTFALGSIKLESATLSSFGIEYTYPIDDDWLHILHAYSQVSASGNIQASWHIEGDFIHAKESVIFIEFIKRVPGPNQFSQLFVQALAARIAADLAIPIAQDRKLQSDMWALYQAKLNEAISRDGMQGRSEIIRSKRVLNARSRSR